MSRVKTFDSTGVAPNGRLYAGDLNAIQDQYADIINLAQALSVGSITVGESGLAISRFGAGVMGIAGTLRISNLVNAIAGFQVNGVALASTHLSDSATLARLASPAFTGAPSAPTPPQDDNDTSLATTQFVISQLSSSSPVMDGAAAIGVSPRGARADHVHPVDTSRAPLASPGLTGTPTAPTPAAADNSTKIATTAFVIQNAMPPGAIAPYVGISVPTGWLLCDGSAVARATYPNLFAAIVASLGAGTVTIASPGVWTLNAHGLNNGDVIFLETTGALPTGLSPDVAYFVVASTANTFQLAVTKGGAAINTSGTQSGTHTVFRSPYSGSFGATTFNLPDMRGRIPVGKNTATFINLGATGGEEAHVLLLNELAQHSHGGSVVAITAGTPSGSITIAGSGNLNTGTESADHSHSGSTGGQSAGHTHALDLNYRTDTQGANGGSAFINDVAGVTGATAGTHVTNKQTAGTSNDHTHAFSTGGRSVAHFHTLADHGHPGSSFNGTQLGPHSHVINPDGTNTPHNNLQPYTVVNYIIKT